MSAPILEVKSLVAFYGPTQALFGLDFEVGDGGVTALLGANGAGKTTSLRAVSGLIRREGDIRLRGRPIGGLSTEAVARLGVAHVPDGRGTSTDSRAGENRGSGAKVGRNGKGARRKTDGGSGYSPPPKSGGGHQRAAPRAGGNKGPRWSRACHAPASLDAR